MSAGALSSTMSGPNLGTGLHRLVHGGETENKEVPLQISEVPEEG